jgi:hypothetical protein
MMRTGLLNLYGTSQGSQEAKSKSKFRVHATLDAGRTSVPTGRSVNEPHDPSLPRYSPLVRQFSVIMRTVPTLLQACPHAGIL